MELHRARIKPHESGDAWSQDKASMAFGEQHAAMTKPMVLRGTSGVECKASYGSMGPIVVTDGLAMGFEGARHNDSATSNQVCSESDIYIYI